MKKTFLLPLPLVSLISCGKDEDEKTCTKDAVTIAGTYKITAARHKTSASGAESDYYNMLFTDPFEKDDLITLAANVTATLVDAGVKCSPVGGDVTTWSVSGNTLMLDGDPNNIEGFNCSTLNIS